eukprot:scpid42153/ scgid2517/ 
MSALITRFHRKYSATPVRLHIAAFVICYSAHLLVASPIPLHHGSSSSSQQMVRGRTRRSGDSGSSAQIFLLKSKFTENYLRSVRSGTRLDAKGGKCQNKRAHFIKKTYLENGLFVVTLQNVKSKRFLMAADATTLSSEPLQVRLRLLPM